MLGFGVSKGRLKMAFKTRREKRYNRLRANYLLPFEANPLSRVPEKVCPYIKGLMRDRYKLFLRAKALGTAKEVFARQVKELYRIKGWTKKDRLGRLRCDVWKMFREFEEKYKAKFPEYDSPWMKRVRNWRFARAKIEHTMAKQRGLA